MRTCQSLTVGLSGEKTGNLENWTQIVRSWEMPVNRESRDEILRVERSETSQSLNKMFNMGWLPSLRCNKVFYRRSSPYR